MSTLQVVQPRSCRGGTQSYRRLRRGRHPEVNACGGAEVQQRQHDVGGRDGGHGEEPVRPEPLPGGEAAAKLHRGQPVALSNSHSSHKPILLSEQWRHWGLVSTSSCTTSRAEFINPPQTSSRHGGVVLRRISRKRELHKVFTVCIHPCVSLPPGGASGVGGSVA